MLRQIFFTFLCVLFTSTIHGQSIREKIQDAYYKFANLASLQNGQAAFTVMDNKTKEVIFESNGQKGMPTASTLKVITSITALDILGPNFTFSTSLYYSGDIDNQGVLHGNIIIEGGGDPSLASERYAEDEPALLHHWKQVIRDAGIKKIEGTIIGDDRLYNGYQAPGGYNWSDLGNYYGAGVSSLNWRENKIGINFTPQKIKEEARLIPPAKQFNYLTFINEVTTGSLGSGDNVYGFSAPYSSIIFLRGSYGSDLKKTIELSSPNPAQDAAYALYTKLKNAHISVSEKPHSLNLLVEKPSLAQGKKLLHKHTSPPLNEIIYWFNKKSINLYGEALLIAIGKKQTGTTNIQESSRIVQNYWHQKLSIPKEEIKTHDGSGLSQQNRVTTNAMTRIMHYAKSQKWFPVFAKSLPDINKMMMKSGTIGGTLGYTGYQTSTQNKDVTFSLLVNNYHGSTQAMRQRMFHLLNILK